MTRLARTVLPAIPAALALALLIAPPVAAGELTLAWPPMDDDLTVGYRVYVGTVSGTYDRVEDAGEETRITIDGLRDDQVHYFAVKAYDDRGKESEEFSPEVVSLPRPRVESIDPPSLAAEESTFVTLRGVNIDPEVQVRVLDSRLALRSAVSAGPGAVTLLLEASDLPEGQDTIELLASSFTLINPGRKAEEYFETHPEAVDLDGSGWVDESDLISIRSSFGARRGDDLYSSRSDLNGDGQVDGADLERVMARMQTPAVPPVSEPAGGNEKSHGTNEERLAEDFE